MKKNNFFNVFIVLISLLSVSQSLAYDKVAIIPLDDIRMPSDDLLTSSGEHLSAEQLWQLSKNKKIDLSKLTPKESEVWKNKLGVSIDDITADWLNLAEDKAAQFEGSLTSAPGQYRFNVSQAGEGEIYTVVMEKTLHTLLLRKNLLRKLGYIIPKMDYRRKLKIQFSSKEEMETFLTKSIPNATLGASARWVTKKDEKNLIIHLQDVVVMKPSERDHYNFAMGLVPRTMTSRVMRSLIIPYALLNIRESANKLRWSEGRIDNQSVRLPHFTSARMNASIHDAKWALRRLAKLTRAELAQCVELAYFPPEVEKLLIEKIVARRNHLLKIFNIKHNELPNNVNIAHGKRLVSGKLNGEKWQGYASRFAHGNPDSPFDDWQYNVLSKVQSEAILTLVSRINGKLRAFDPNEKRLEYHRDQFEKGLKHFVETGEFLEFGVGTWVSPTLDGNIILNRNIVVGSYMGTDNLVQLADTFGVSVSLGAHIGIEGLPAGYGAFAKGQLNLVKTYTHLKPVKTLKQSLKEPYINLFVPFIKMQLEKQAKALSETIGNGENINEEDKKTQLEEILTHINKYLGIGESLIISERLSPKVLAGGGYNLMETRFSLAVGGEHANLKRIHLYRSSADKIQIYVDNGTAKSIFISFSVSNIVNALTVHAKRSFGQYEVKMHDLNINMDQEENPDIESNALALEQLLKTGSSELLNEVHRPYIIKSNFLDDTFRLRLLFLNIQSLKGRNNLVVETPKGRINEFLHVTDESQQGLSFRNTTVDLVNYYLRKYFEGFSLSNSSWGNPAFTFGGSSETTRAKFESKIVKNKKGKRVISRPYIGITDTQQGWEINQRRLIFKLHKINKKYGAYLFPRNVVRNIDKLRLYNVSVNVNIYEKGIANIKKITKKRLRDLEKIYKRKRGSNHGCGQNDDDKSNANTYKCGSLNSLVWRNKKCSKLYGSEKHEEIARCLIKFAKDLHIQLDYKDFVSFVGKDQHYIYGTVNGFRVDSEILYEPEYSNSLGRIQSRHVTGPLGTLQRMIGAQGGEFHGRWIRESLQ